jgi:hypothetical protein
MQVNILNDFWLTSDPIDFEYKKYLLLAYDQKLKQEFDKRKLYPHLTDIVDKLSYVNDFLKNLMAFENSAKEIDRIDWLQKEIVYRTKINDEMFDDVKYIAWYSQNILSDLYIQFKNLYDDIDGSIVITGNRFSIFDKHSGYLQIKFNKKEKILYYEIYKTLYPEPMFHLKTMKPNLKDYYQDRYRKNIFEIVINENFPAKESTIPVMRRKLLLHVLGNYLL